MAAVAVRAVADPVGRRMVVVVVVGAEAAVPGECLVAAVAVEVPL